MFQVNDVDIKNKNCTFDYTNIKKIFLKFSGGHNLFVQDKEVATLIENLYSKLKLVLVKKDEQKNNALLSHLKKINDHLAQRQSRFLTGDTMCCFDCELM
jgi:chloride intracellular channel protein 2